MPGTKLMSNKQDIMIEKLISIESRLGGIEQHLKTLNGRTANNENNHLKNTEDINKINKKHAYFAGAITVILIGFELFWKVYL